jgi:hypothetical protein
MANYQVNHELVRALREGIISIDVHFESSGFEDWVRFTNPLPGMEIVTHKSMSIDSAIPLVREHYQRSMRVSPPASPAREDTTDIEPGGVLVLRKGLFVPSVSEANRLCKERALDRVKTFAGSTNTLASDSLTLFDLERSPEDLLLRCVVVADNIGAERAVARIATDADLRQESSRSLHEWWSRASGYQRLRILTRHKVLAAEDAKGYQTLRLEGMGCPFWFAPGRVVETTSGQAKLASRPS